MSLVNQVLRDLDARREAPPLDDALEGLRSAPSSPRAAHKAGVALGVTVLLGLAGTLGWLYLQTPAPEPSVQTAQSGPAPVSAPKQGPAPAARTPVLQQAARATPPPQLEPGAGFQAVVTPPSAPEPKPVESRPAAAPEPEPQPAPATAAVEPAPTPTSQAPATEPVRSATAGGDMRKTPRPLSPEDRAEQAFADGLEALRHDQWRSAEQQLRAALQADPGHLQARESLAGLLLRQDRRRQAEQVLATGLEAHPQTPSLARLYARLILDRGQTDTAIRVLENALVNAVNDAEYLALLAGIYQRSQRYSEAASSYRAALSLESGRAAWWLGLGLALEGRGELQPATKAYHSALANPGLNEATRRYARERLQRLQALLGRQ